MVWLARWPSGSQVERLAGAGEGAVDGVAGVVVAVAVGRRSAGAGGAGGQEGVRLRGAGQRVGVAGGGVGGTAEAVTGLSGAVADLVVRSSWSSTGRARRLHRSMVWLGRRWRWWSRLR